MKEENAGLKEKNTELEEKADGLESKKSHLESEISGLKKQVEKFLNSEAGKSFKLIKDKKILAHTSGFDGFYMALLEKE